MCQICKQGYMVAIIGRRGDGVLRGALLLIEAKCPRDTCPERKKASKLSFEKRKYAG